MSDTDDEQQRPRRQRRRGEPDLGVLTPPSIPRIDLPGIPAPRRRVGRRASAPAPVQETLPIVEPVGRAAATELARTTALELRNRAARTTRRYLLLLAFCLLAGTSPQLPASGRWLLAAVALVGAVRMAQVWRRAFRRRRQERLFGATTWPGAEDLARL